MHVRKISGAVAATALLALPAAGIAAGSHHVKPASGAFKGSVPYTFNALKATGKLSLTVAHHKLTRLQMMGATMYPPIDAKGSTGQACPALSGIDTKSHRVKGTIRASGRFSYTFTQSFKAGGKVASTDTVTVRGRFRNAKHVTGTVSDVVNFTAISAPGKGKCVSGTLKFSAAHA